MWEDCYNLNTNVCESWYKLVQLKSYISFQHQVHDQLSIILILKPNLLCEDTEHTVISLVWVENLVLYHLYKIMFVKIEEINSWFPDK